jgi:hypothetical protein
MCYSQNTGHPKERGFDAPRGAAVLDSTTLFDECSDVEAAEAGHVNYCGCQVCTVSLGLQANLHGVCTGHVAPRPQMSVCAHRNRPNNLGLQLKHKY